MKFKHFKPFYSHGWYETNTIFWSATKGEVEILVISFIDGHIEGTAQSWMDIRTTTIEQTNDVGARDFSNHAKLRLKWEPVSRFSVVVQHCESHVVHLTMSG